MRGALEWFTSHETRQCPSWNALSKDFIDRFSSNVEIVPDRYSLEKMKQKYTESYRKFAYKWRKEAARVRPPMSEKEIVEVFERVQEPEYYDRIMLLIGTKFAEIVKIGEIIKDDLKLGKIARVSASPGSSGLLKKKREDKAAISYEGKKNPRRSSFSHFQGHSRPSQNSYRSSQKNNPLPFTKIHLYLPKSISHLPKSTSNLPKSISHIPKSSSNFPNFVTLLSRCFSQLC